LLCFFQTRVWPPSLIEITEGGVVHHQNSYDLIRVLAKAARLARDAKQWASYGLTSEPPQVDFLQLLTRSQQVVYQIHEKKQLLAQLAHAGVEVYSNVGSAQFVDPHTLALANSSTGLSYLHGDCGVGGVTGSAPT
jgi:hypothetical protein